MKLNAQQQQAVSYLNGPLRIVAGAGAGKTRVITHKIKYLITKKFRPERIAAITFTNKATNEMKIRLAKMTSPEASRQILVSTYHALCVRILRSDLHFQSFTPSFRICDQEDQKILIKKFARQLVPRSFDTNEAEIGSKQVMACGRLIEKLKKRSLYPDAPNFKAQTAHCNPVEIAIYRAYQKYLQTINHLDFNDLINYTYRILKSDAAVRQKWQSKFDYILVDEFQDTDRTQLELIKMLAGDHITVVGDPNQMIYGWRGADSKIFHNFSQLFPCGHTIFLNQNYRSTPEILALANNFMHSHGSQTNKLIANKQHSGELPLVAEFYDRYSEARWICTEIKKLKTKGYSEYDIIILMRANYLSRTIEELFREHKIKFKLLHDFPFWRRTEIKDCLAALDILLLGDNFNAWERVVATVKGIGPVNLVKLNDLLQKQGLTWPQLFTSTVKGLVSPNVIKLLSPLKRLINLQQMNSSPETIWSLARRAFSGLGWLDVNGSDRTEIEILNIEELIAVLKEKTNDEKRLLADWKVWFTDFIDRIRISQEEKENDAKLRSAVRVMTVHKAKGLESKIVFIISVNENVLPSARSSDLREERRIFYVAMTRAQEQLKISYHLGQRYDHTASIRSNFIDEFDQRYYRFYAPKTTDDFDYNPKTTYKIIPPIIDKMSSLRLRNGTLVDHPFYGQGKILKQKFNNLIVDFADHGIQIIRASEVKVSQ